MNFRKPLTHYTKQQVEEMGWKYYNPEIHEASFAMPQFAKKVCYFVIQWIADILPAHTHPFHSFSREHHIGNLGGKIRRFLTRPG